MERPSYEKYCNEPNYTKSIELYCRDFVYYANWLEKKVNDLKRENKKLKKQVKKEKEKYDYLNYPCKEYVGDQYE